MSEYQCHEFVALDRPLTPRQMEELRRISTRAEITTTRFWNEYHWGDLKADPATLLARHFDAHHYFANWGTHRLMLKIPKAKVDVKALKPYLAGRRTVSLRTVGAFLTIDLESDTEEPEDEDEASAGSLAALTPLRAELMSGDLRCAYLAWLLAVQSGEVDNWEKEPAVPSDLGALTSAQEALVEFLRIDPDLVAAASRASPAAVDDRDPVRAWVMGLGSTEKNRWLRLAVDDPELPLGARLHRAFRAKAPRSSERQGSGEKRRTVAELLRLAAHEQATRERAAVARAKKVDAAAARARTQRLAKLARDQSAAWSELERLVASSAYGEAVVLAVDLRDLAARDGDAAAFRTRFEALRRRNARRRGFFDRWKQAGAES